jgi:hypothetical protein
MDSVWNRNSLVPFVVHIAFECMACNTYYQEMICVTKSLCLVQVGTAMDHSEHCCQKIMECVANCDHYVVSTQNVLCTNDPWCWAWMRRAARCCGLEPCEWIHCGDVLTTFFTGLPFLRK